MNSFQQAQMIARLSELWAAMNRDAIPLDSESRWGWCLVVGQVHALTGCASNRIIEAFADQLHSVGCIFNYDRMGKITLYAKREKVNGSNSNKRETTATGTGEHSRAD